MTKLDDLEKQLETVKKKIAAERKALKEKELRDRKRKIEIIGDYVLSKAEKNGSIDQLVQELVSASALKKRADFELFGLSLTNTGVSGPSTQTPE